MAYQWKLPYTICLYFLLFLSIFLLSSCHTLPPAELGIKEETRPVSSAEILFLNGNFERARDEFETLLMSESSFEQKQLALYGFACTQLMLAANEEDFLEAISNLQKWDAVKGSDPFIENHHMLILALKQQGDLIKQKNAVWTLRTKNKNILIRSQKKKIAEMATIVNKLHKQIEELEEIDQIFQEKRKPHE